MTKKLVMLGAGGHAKVLYEAIDMPGCQLIAIVSPEPSSDFEAFRNVARLDSDEDVLNFESEDVLLLNGIGSLPGSTLRTTLHEYFSSNNFRFETVISPRAYVSPSAVIEEGVQIMAGAIVQAGAVLGESVIVNSGAVVEHDCVIGAHSHVAPGATLSGNVNLGRGVHIGTGANIIQGINVGEHSVVAAGTTLVKDLAAKTKAVGSKASFSEMSL